MEQIVILKTTREVYDIRNCTEHSYSVAELIERLEKFPKDVKVVFSNDNGYTFGGIDGGTIRIIDVETKEEEEERISKEEEEDLVCPNCESDNIYWSVRGHMRCMNCDATFKKGKKIKKSIAD